MADGDKNKDIVFRRIRGRIVPIRVNRSRSSGSDSARKKTGATLAVSSFGVAATGGVVQRRFQKRAREFRVKAFRTAGLAERALSQRGRKGKSLKLGAKSQGFRIKAKQLIKKARGTRSFTIGVAGTLLGIGLERLAAERKTETQQIVADLGSGVVGSALTAAFLLGRKKISITKLRKALNLQKPGKTPDFSVK